MNLLEVFEGSNDLLDLPAGTQLFAEGDPGDIMYVLLGGSLQLTLHGKPIAKVAEGEIIGEMALLGTEVRSATAVADSDCQLVPIDTHAFKLLVQHMPDFALHVMNVLAMRLQQVDEELTVGD
mgnify:FL=1